jgi:DNA gyrase subunit A
MAVRSPVDQVSVIGRHTQGVRIVSLKEGDRVVSFAKVALEETEGDTAAGVPVEPPPLTPEGADEEETGDEPEPEEEAIDEGEEPAENGGEPKP